MKATGVCLLAIFVAGAFAVPSRLPCSRAMDGSAAIMSVTPGEESDRSVEIQSIACGSTLQTGVQYTVEADVPSSHRYVIEADGAGATFTQGHPNGCASRTTSDQGTHVVMFSSPGTVTLRMVSARGFANNVGRAPECTLTVEAAPPANVDECATGAHNCHAMATCTDTDASFTCACNAGYTGNGEMCTLEPVDPQPPATPRPVPENPNPTARYNQKVSSLSCGGSYRPEYTVKVMNYWTAERHPTNFPGNAHTSPGNLVSHNHDYTMYTIGAPASLGIKNVAETGNPAEIQSEFASEQGSGSVADYGMGPIMWFNDMAPPASPPFPLVTDDYAKVSVQLDADHTLISWAHMLAPSPDWWTGFAGLDLCEDGKWVDEVTIYSRAYDAGTDSGNTYTAADSVTDPVENIFRITDGDLEYNGEVAPVARYVISRNRPQEPESHKLSKLSCKGTYSPEYSVTVTNYWRENRHPGNFPTANAHTSPGQLISHNGDYEMFNTDSMASQGMKNVAETGNPAVLQAEFDMYDDEIFDREQGPVLWWTPRDAPGVGAPPGAVIGEVAELTISVDRDNSLISYAHMLAPSPDWFTGLFGFDLCEDGSWVDEVVVWTPPYDAGTDCGMHATAPDQPCGPHNVHEIVDDPDFLLGGSVLPVARFNIKRIAAKSEPSVPFAWYQVSYKPCDTPMLYDVNIKSTWSGVNHPTNYPANAHFSPGNLVSHGSDYSLFRVGEKASSGIKYVAETGSPMMIQGEFVDNAKSGSVLDRFQGNLLWWGVDAPPHALPGREDELEILVDYHHPMISYATMLAPSPDWFTGFYDVNMCYDGYWLESAVLDTPPYDSGTDCGDDFTSEDCESDPVMDVFEIESGHVLGTVNSLATFDINMMGPPDSCTPEFCCDCNRFSCRQDVQNGNCAFKKRKCALDCNEYCYDEKFDFVFDAAKEAEGEAATTVEAQRMEVEVAAADVETSSKLSSIFQLSVVAVGLLAVMLLAIVFIAWQRVRQEIHHSKPHDHA